MLRFHGGSQLLEKPPDRLGAMPPDHVGRDFIADQVAKDSGMAPAIAYPGGNGVADLSLGCSAVEESYVLRPRKADQEFQAGFLGRIGQPSRRHRENTYG